MAQATVLCNFGEIFKFDQPRNQIQGVVCESLVTPFLHVYVGYWKMGVQSSNN